MKPSAHSVENQLDEIIELIKQINETLKEVNNEN